jgi:hypothetical protein
MYSYDRRAKSAGLYQSPMEKLVQEVDECAKVQGSSKSALRALVGVEKLIKKDVGGLVSALLGLDQHAPQQHIDRLREALQTLQSAATQVGSTYDDMNAAFIRMGLK